MTPLGFTVPAMLPASAEIFLLGMACVVLLVDVWLPEQHRRLTYQLSQATLAATALLVLSTFPRRRSRPSTARSWPIGWRRCSRCSSSS